jgi:hypothetical protein
LKSGSDSPPSKTEFTEEDNLSHGVPGISEIIDRDKYVENFDEYVWTEVRFLSTPLA